MSENKKLIEEFTKRLVDQGKIIEAGWIGLKMTSIPADASKTQIKEMRNSFFAGAQHLYSSIMTMLEPGQDETENDLTRMALIDTELRNFIKEFKEEHFI